MSSYEVERFESEPDRELICPICHCLLYEPTVTPCQHAFCDACIKTWILSHLERTHEGDNEEDFESAPCPACRQNFPAESPDLNPSPEIAEQIAELRIRCINVMNGCDVVLPVKQLASHERECMCRRMYCRFPVCRRALLAKEKQEHEEGCECRTVTCSRDCKLEIPFKDYESHDCMAKLRNLNEGYAMTTKFMTGLYSVFLKRMGKHCGCLEWASQKMTDYLDRVHGDLDILARMYTPEAADIQWAILQDIQKGVEFDIPTHDDAVQQLTERFPNMTGPAAERDASDGN